MLRKQYEDETAVLEQQEDNAERELKYRNLHNWANGTSNRMKRQWLETSTPQYSTDPVTGKIYYNGTEADLAENNQSYASTSDEYAEKWGQVYDKFKKTLSPEAAEKATNLYFTNYMKATVRSGRSGRSQLGESLNEAF